MAMATTYGKVNPPLAFGNRLVWPVQFGVDDKASEE